MASGTRKSTETNHLSKDDSVPTHDGRRTSWNRNKNRRKRIPSAQIVEWLRQIGLKVVTNWEVNLTAARVAQNKRDVPAARITEQPPDSNERQSVVQRRGYA